MPPGVGVSQPSAGPSKDDFFMLDQFGGKKAMGHMQSVETSPMRFPGSGVGGGGGVVMSKGSPLPPSQSNNLLLPQPYNGDMQMMQMGPGGGGIPPPPPPSMNHHGPHHHAVHHHPGHSPLHAPAGPYSGPPQPPTSLHPYHQNAGPGGGAVAGMPYNPMLPPTPNQLSPMDKFAFDPTKFNPNIRVSPNLGGQPGPPLPPPPPPVMSRSPRNFPNPGLPPNNKGGGGGGGGFNQNHNMFMNDMMGPPGNQMVGGGAQMANNHKQGGPPNPPNMNDYGGNKGDYLSIQQQAKNSSSSYYWRKQQPNQQMPPPSSPQQNMKSPSHLGGGGGGGVGVPMSKGHLLHAGGGGGNAMNKSVGGYPGNMQNASLNEIMSPRQPPKNSPTFFGKDDLPYWAMGSGGGGGGAGPQGPQAPPQHPNGDTMHPREMQRNHVMSGPNGGPHNMSHLYGEAAAGPVGPPSANNNNNSNSTRRMFDRSDSILAGEDAPFEGNATTSKFGPIQRKASNSLGSGDTLKGSLGGLDLRHQAWLNSSQAGLQTSPRMMPQIPIGSEKKLSPSKELGGSHQQQHLVSGVSGTVDHVYP